MRLPFGSGIVALSPQGDHVSCRLTLTDMRDFSTAVARCRRLLDLDADPVAVDATLAKDPVLRPLVKASPGRRVPRTVDEHELALRVVLGQQISTRAARTHTGRLVIASGEAIDDPHGGLTHLFPATTTIAEIDPTTLAMPDSRRRTFISLAQALADGKLDLSVGGDWDTALERLGEVPGVGPWTRSTIAMRALGDPDAFLPSDLGVRLAAEARGLPSSPAALTERARRWRPWRAYAVQYLWGTGHHPINQLPTTDARRSRGP
jgi:AraC family transcriptional regulator of adaptative response / DNA-3-methyladenine glycosylase II